MIIEQSTRRWMQLKADLLSTAPHLEDFQTPIEANVARRVVARGKYPLPLNPLIFESYLGDVSASLDRCLSYRREARELEIAGVKAAVDYAHFPKSRSIEQKVDQLSLLLEAKKARKNEIETYLSSTPNEGPDVYQILRETLRIESTASAPELAAISDKSKAIDDRWTEATAVAEAYNARCSAAGNAHNFSERYNRVLGIYADEMFEVVAKVAAIRTGIQIVHDFALEEPPSAMDQEGFLDELVTWCRSAIRFANSRTEIETFFNLTVPLVQPWGTDPNSHLVSEEDFRAVFRSHDPVKVLKFRIDKLTDGIDNLRLQGIGLSFGSKLWGSKDGSAAWRDDVSGYRLRATMYLPPTKAISENNPIPFGNVTVHASDAPAAWYDGPRCKNRSPIGDWRIAIQNRAVWHDGSEKLVDAKWWGQVVPDIKLTFRLAGRVIGTGNSVFV